MPFPSDEYTPHGYLNTRGHTRVLNPLGVLRSQNLGFRWHFPAFAGSYGGREVYRAGFNVGLDDALDLADCDRVFSPYHSSNVFVFDAWKGDAQCRCDFHPVGEDALRALVHTHGNPRVTLHAEYTRTISAGGEWGESGLVGRVEDGLLVLQSFEDGEAFVLWTSRPPVSIAVAAEEAGALDAEPLSPGAFVTVQGRAGERLSLFGTVRFDASEDAPLEVIFARGRTVLQARRNLDAARRDAATEQAALLARDEAFWNGAPRLYGDWPAHWRRGMVYDLETLRMMVRPPAGIYRHPWDAMQIQAPRVVLAEAAMDALVLSYADLDMARAVLLGTFQDAPEPNIPCSREDGSYNMVAADGTVCGTAPEWGYPWLVLRWLYLLDPSPSWLAAIYPRLAEYLDWWLAHRRDNEGWLVYACSWESGQDESPRFGEQPLGGGTPIRHIRPVDLQAAFAHACGVMTRFASVLGRGHDAAKWRALADEFVERTAYLWNGARFADFDSRTGNFTSVNDIMLLAPLVLGIAEDEHRLLLSGTVRDVDASTLTWPMEAWTAVESALALGLTGKAAELVGQLCDRVYGFWDARSQEPGTTLPGVSCEYWPPGGRCGGEGYGWGAFCTHLLLHTLVGFAPTPDGATLRPNLPVSMRLAGACYGVHLSYRGRPVEISLEPSGGEKLCLKVNDHNYEVAWGQQIDLAPELLAG